MSEQISLDSLSGIDWSCPKLAQLEQFALDCVPDCKTRMESHQSSMCVAVEAGGSVAWLRPSFEINIDGRFAWLVRIGFADGSCYAVADSGDLEAMLRCSVGTINNRRKGER